MRAQVATRFNTSRQNNVKEDKIWIINKSRLVDRRGEIRVYDTGGDSKKYEPVSN